MSSNLENLFEHILQSEQYAQKRKTQIQEVRIKNVECVETINIVHNELKSLEGQLLLKVQEWNDLDLEVHLMTNKRDILQEQREDWEGKSEQLRKELQEMISEQDASRKLFLQSMQEFYQGYDLISNGQSAREVAAKADIDAVKDEQQSKIKALTDFKCKKNESDKLSNERATLSEQLQTLEQAHAVLSSKLQTESDQVQVLELQKVNTSKILQTDPEFKRLQHELDACRYSRQEDTCRILQQELQQLQQQLWQKNLQKQRTNRQQ